MKVLIINPIMYTCESGNVKKVESLKDTLFYNICLGFLENGDRPTLVTAGDYKPCCEEEYPFEIVFLDTKFKKVFSPRLIPFMHGLKQFLKKNKNEYDYVLCSEAFQFSTLTAYRVYRERCIIWQEMAKHQKIFKEIPSRLWYNLIVRCIYEKCLIVSRSEKARDFISQYSKNVSPEVIEHGVNIDKFPVDKNKNLSQFIVISQLIRRKRIDKIVDAYYEYRKNYGGKSRLVICGDGDDKHNLQKLSRKLKLTNSIEFAGHCNHSQIAQYLKKTIAMLVYTEKDNNMVSIAESIGSGTPVITNTVPNNAQYIEDNDLGIVSDTWGGRELKEIENNFSKYYENCVAYRHKLSSEYVAKRFDDEFKKHKEKYDK